MEKLRRSDHLSLEEITDLEAALEQVRQQGYDHTFQFAMEGWRCEITKKTYCPQMLTMDGCHRLRLQTYRGKSSITVLYLVTAPDGTKGMILDNFTTYGNALFGEYLLRMKLRHLPSKRRKLGS